MSKLYNQGNGKIHLLLGGYSCNPELGKLEPTRDGDRSEITCKNCIARLNY